MTIQPGLEGRINSKRIVQSKTNRSLPAVVCFIDDWVVGSVSSSTSSNLPNVSIGRSLGLPRRRSLPAVQRTLRHRSHVGAGRQAIRAVREWNKHIAGNRCLFASWARLFVLAIHDGWAQSEHSCTYPSTGTEPWVSGLDLARASERNSARRTAHALK